MAETSTAVNVCDAAIFLDNAAGVPTEISGSMNQFVLTYTNQLGEYRTFEGCWMRRLECGKDGGVTINAWYTRATAESKQLLVDWFFTGCQSGLRTLSVYIPNKNVGSDMYRAEFRIESLEIGGDVTNASPAPVTVVLKPDGAVTHTVAAT